LKHDHSAIATSGGSSGSPAGITPAQTVATLPGIARGIAPIVDGLSAGCGCKCCGGNQHRQCIEFLHGSPHGGLSRRLAAKKGTYQVTITRYGEIIVPQPDMLFRSSCCGKSVPDLYITLYVAY
jgi:hypothetical protein